MDFHLHAIGIVRDHMDCGGHVKILHVRCINISQFFSIIANKKLTIYRIEGKYHTIDLQYTQNLVNVHLNIHFSYFNRYPL